MKVLYTSALISNKYDDRKVEYQKSFFKLLNFFKKEDITVIECYSQNPDFLDEFGCDLFHSNTHLSKIKNKGVLEILALKKFLESKTDINFLFLKLTGRYELIDNDFINTINQNPGFDFYGKLVDNNTQVFTGCFAINGLVLLEFINHQDLDFMETNMINFEKLLFDFIKEKNTLYVNKINLIAPIFGVGNIDLQLV